MQKRKILFIGLLAIFAIVIAGSASAFDLGFLTGDSGPETVTIEGIDFNIPEGYKEDENYSYVNETASSGSVKYVMNGKTFENDKGDAIAILIADYGKYNVTEDILKHPWLTQNINSKGNLAFKEDYIEFKKKSKLRSAIMASLIVNLWKRITFNK